MNKPLTTKEAAPADLAAMATVLAETYATGNVFQRKNSAVRLLLEAATQISRDSLLKDVCERMLAVERTHCEDWGNLAIAYENLCEALSAASEDAYELQNDAERRCEDEASELARCFSRAENGTYWGAP